MKVIIACLFAIAIVNASVPIKNNMRTIGTAIKNGDLGHNEQTFFQYSGDPGVITEMWFTGGGDDYADTRIRIYIDGEAQPSLDFNLFLAHGIGSHHDQAVPWGTKRISHSAHSGGVYNTYRIPFSKSIKITGTLAPQTKGNQVFWFICRGVTNYPVIIGDLQLPSTARLHLYKNINTVLQPLQYITLAHTENAGLLYQVTLSTTSTDYNYLEACFRALLDDDSSFLYLSSGTEDYFLSAFYYSGGEYHFDNSGLTYLNDTISAMSAYKFHENDPVIFTKRFSLFWRCGEDGACPTKFPPQESKVHTRSPKLAVTNTTTYTWIYEWPPA